MIMSRGLCTIEKDDNELVKYLLSDKELVTMGSKGTVKNIRKQTVFNGMSLDDMFEHMFNGGGFTNNLQNKMLITLIYGSAGENPYMDDMLVSFIQGIYRLKPKSRENQNKMLKVMAENIDAYAPYSEKLGGLARYVDYCIEANNRFMSNEGLPIKEEQILDKVSKQRLDLQITKSYKEARQILTKKGWDLAKYPEDEELLRTVFNLEREETRAGHQIYKKYVETVLSRTIHNEIDRDNVYKDFQHFLHENNLHRYKNVESLDKFIGAVIYSSKEEVEMCQRKTAEKNLSKNVNNGSKISVKGRGR